jgi:hypothetical protein
MDRVAAATLAIGSVACFVGTLAARLPLGPGNVATHYGYPFFMTAITVVFLGAARAIRETRMARVVSLVALGYAVNSLLIALVTYGGTPEGSFIPLKGVALLEDVFFLAPDIGLVGFLVPLLPDARPTGLRRRVLAALAGATGLIALGQLFVPHIVNNTIDQDPLGIPALAPLAGAVGVGVGLLFVVSGLTSLCSGVVTSRRGHGAGPASAGATILAIFVAQAAAPESSWWAAGAVMLVGCSVLSVLIVRTVRRALAVNAR